MHIQASRFTVQEGLGGRVLDSNEATLTAQQTNSLEYFATNLFRVIRELGAREESYCS